MTGPLNNSRLAPEGVRAAALAIAADAPLVQMHRAIKIAQKAITAYLGSTGAVAPEPAAWLCTDRIMYDRQSAITHRELAFARQNQPDAWTVQPLYTHPAPADTGQGGRVEAATHRHKKRGSEYVLLGIGRMQAERWLDKQFRDYMETADGESYEMVPVNMCEVAIYRSVDDGSLWVRPREEFEDGRFDALNAGART